MICADREHLLENEKTYAVFWVIAAYILVCLHFTNYDHLRHERGGTAWAYVIRNAHLSNLSGSRLLFIYYGKFASSRYARPTQIKPYSNQVLDKSLQILPEYSRLFRWNAVRMKFQTNGIEFCMFCEWFGLFRHDHRNTMKWIYCWVGKMNI